jgi:transposase
MSDELAMPDDLQACQTLVEQLVITVAEQQHQIATLEDKHLAQQLEIAYLIKLAFSRRSERYLDDPNQLKLDLGSGDEAHDAAEGLHDAKQEQAAADELIIAAHIRRKQAKAEKPRDEKLPAHLLRYEVEAKATDEQQHCETHGPREIIGHDRLESLEYVRPQLKVRVTVYPKFACPQAPECGVTSPERAVGLVEGNRYDTSIAAEIITGKYGYHLPVYREQDWFASSGWTPSRSTLLNIMMHAALLISPLIKYFADCVREDTVIGTDDTGVTLLLPKDVPPIDPDDSRSQRIHEVLTAAREKGAPSASAKMWAYRGVNVRLNVFDFTVSRHRDGPDEFLIESDYTGTIMADCYSGYQGIALRSEGLVQRGACNSHARRKIFDARSNHPVVACMLLAMYQELYDIEHRGKLLSNEARLELRQQEATVVWTRMRAYLDSPVVKNLLPKEAMGKAVAYVNNQWDALQLYLTNGGIPIDNNDAEQLMKQVAVGRKNWLFIGSIAAGGRAADLMTLVSSALRNDLDVSSYVKGVLDALLSGSKDYEQLRPDVWAAAHPDQIREYRREERRDRADRKQFRRALRRQAQRQAAR